jgi:hypothetical protein
MCLLQRPVSEQVRPSELSLAAAILSQCDLCPVFPQAVDVTTASALSQGHKPTWSACRVRSGKPLNVGARHGGIASHSGRDTDRVDFVRHSAVRALPHVRHHRGYRLAYPANPEKRERALLAPLNVLSSRQRHEQARVFACHWPSPWPWLYFCEFRLRDV